MKPQDLFISAITRLRPALQKLNNSSRVISSSTLLRQFPVRLTHHNNHVEEKLFSVSQMDFSLMALEIIRWMPSVLGSFKAVFLMPRSGVCFDVIFLYDSVLKTEILLCMKRLQLLEFATECSWDHLYIYDGDSVLAPLLAVFR